ncbi:MAG: hypothetical protein J6A97_09975 [Clostridia bacterium]|nr:hypothetical protein [Clostridia bacterium]
MIGYYCYSTLPNPFYIPFFAYHGNMVFCYISLAITAVFAFILTYINWHRLRLPYIMITASALIILTMLLHFIATDLSMILAFVVLAVAFVYVIAATVTAVRRKNE